MSEREKSGTEIPSHVAAVYEAAMRWWDRYLDEQWRRETVHELADACAAARRAEDSDGA